MQKNRFISVIVLAFIVLGAIYALTTPVFEASDELWHYPMIHHLADGNPLPVQVFDPAQAGPWKQEASQPPLYYYVGALLTFWIDTSDMAEVRRLNPHVDNGVVTVDRNINLIVHDPALSPWEGTLLAVRIVRMASVLMSAVTVYLTYRIAREVLPGRPEIALGAAAINAFTPMFLFISGAVNNDNLAVMLASLALLLMLRIVRRGDGVANGARHAVEPRLAAWILLGVVIGLAVLTKEGTLGLIPMALGTALIATWQKKRSELLAATHETVLKSLRALLDVAIRSLFLFMLVLLPILIIAGWWYYRNLVLYGDWLGWSAFVAVLGQRPQAATLTQLWDERWGFLASYWGLFGGVNVPMPDWIYTVLNSLLVLAVPGFLLFGGRLIQQWRVQQRDRRKRAASQLWRVSASILDFVAAHFGLVVVVLFSIAVVIGLINWATTTWSSQGRLAFTAISALSTLLALGLFGWQPEPAARVSATAVGTLLFAVSALAPFLWISPAYEPRVAQPPTPLEPVAITFGEKFQITAVALASDGQLVEALQPGDALDVYLQWRALQPMTENWSIFVHLNDPVLQTPIAQRDMFPGGGLLATTFITPGMEMIDHFRLRVPQTAFAPADLTLVAGLYNYATNERLPSEHGDAVALQTISLVPTTGGEDGVSTALNFGDEIALTDFSIEPRLVGPGEIINLSLEWEALRSLDEDYTIFAQLLTGNDNTRWAAMDLPLPTSSWNPGQTETVSMTLSVDEGAAPGIYRLIVGAYTRTSDGGFDRLQLVRDGRITMDDVIQLTQIRVE